MKLPAKPLTPPVEADGLLALLLELEQDVHGARLGVALDLGVLRLDAVEIVELVEPQQG